MNIEGFVNKVNINSVAKIAFIGIGILLVYRIAKSAKRNIDTYTYVVSAPTLSNLQISGLATKIAEAWGGILNDNENAVYEAFSALGNKDDLVLLMRAYSFKNENLQQSISKRMSNKEIQKINSILAGKGIDYKF